MPSPNPHETAARLRKVLRLVEAIDRLMARDTLRRVQPDEIPGVLATMDPAWWAEIATKAGVRMPSSTTIAAVREVYARRSQRAAS